MLKVVCVVEHTWRSTDANFIRIHEEMREFKTNKCSYVLNEYFKYYKCAMKIKKERKLMHA